jgi:hypothetical protein
VNERVLGEKTMKVAWLVGVVVVAVLVIGSPVKAQQLLGGLTGSQCSARGGQITTWTSTAGRGPNVGDCYIAPRSGGGSAGGFTGGGGGLGALGAGLQFLDALSNFVDSLPSNDAPAAASQPVYDYKDTPEYREMERQQRALQSALSQETDDLQNFVRSGKPSATTTARADMCAGYADIKSDLTQCYRTAAAALEQEAAKCAAPGCRATMLRAAASARCVAGLAPSAAAVSATIATCGKDPASGLQRVAATSASQAPAAPATGASRAPGASTASSASSARAAPTAPANHANAQSDAALQGAQRPRWIAPGSAAECAKLAQSSIARNTAGYYDLCVSDPPKSAAAAKPRAPLQRTSAPGRPLNVQLPSPSDEHGCTWYGGSLRPDGSCRVIGLTTSDCNDLHGRVTESEGYKYCVIGGPAGEPSRAAAAPSSPSDSGAPASDDALDRCRDGAAAPWTVAGCYDLLGQPAAQNRPGALIAKIRDSIRRGLNNADAERQRRESAEQESAEEQAVQAQLWRDWRDEATRRYDRWVAGNHPFVAENTAARDACAGRWVWDGTSAGTCDPTQTRARWELAFEPRPSPSVEEQQRVADHGQPWRTNSETDCRNVGGIPIKPKAEDDITGLPTQLLDDPTVDQAALRRSFLCYQTLGRSN